MLDKDYELNNSIENEEDEDEDEYDIGRIFSRMEEEEQKRKAAMTDEEREMEEMNNAIGLLTGMTEDCAFSSMEDIMALGKLMDEINEDEEQERSAEQKAAEAEADKRAYDDFMKRMEALKALESFDAISKFFDEKDE